MGGCSGEESLPIGLEVVHTPAEVDDVKGPNPDPNDWKYRWTFRTEVRATNKPLRITRFGILAWDGTRWVLDAAQSQYNSGVLGPTEFIEWYACPDASVKPGRPCVDSQNWAGSRTLSEFKQKWFYVGVDADGTSHKGEGVVTLHALPPR